MRTFIVYTRVSSHTSNENTSEDRQREQCKQFGEAQGWKYLGHIHDTHTGKEFRERKNVNQVLDLIDSGKATDVVFYKVDRMTRGQQVLKEFITEIYALGGRMSIQQKGRTYEKVREALKDTKFEGFIAEMEAEAILERFEDGKEERFRNGSIIHPVPTGYVSTRDETRHKKYLIPVEDTSFSPLVRRAFALFLSTRSISNTVVTLNTEGYKAKQGGMITFKLLTNILDNHMLYAGEDVEQEFKGHKRMFRYPALISAEDAFATAAAYKTRSRASVYPNKPFTKLIQCKCGRHADAGIAIDPKGFQVACTSYKLNKNRRHLSGNKIEIEIPCRYSISTNVFQRELVKFLDSVPTEQMETRFEYELSKMVANTAELMFSIEAEVKYKEALKVRRGEVLKLAAKAFEKEYMELMDGYNDEIKSIAEGIERKTNEIIERKESIANKQRVLKAFSIELSEDQWKKVIDQMRHTYSQSFEIDSEGQLTPLLPGLLEKDGFEMVQGYIGVQVFPSIIKRQAGNIRQQLSEFRKALEAEDWKTVNDEMAKLGLSFEADFSNPVRASRWESIKVVVDFEAVEGLLKTQPETSAYSTSYRRS